MLEVQFNLFGKLTKKVHKLINNFQNISMQAKSNKQAKQFQNRSIQAQ